MSAQTPVLEKGHALILVLVLLLTLSGVLLGSLHHGRYQSLLLQGLSSHLLLQAQARQHIRQHIATLERQLWQTDEPPVFFRIRKQTSVDTGQLTLETIYRRGDKPGITALHTVSNL